MNPCPVHPSESNSNPPFHPYECIPSENPPTCGLQETRPLIYHELLLLPPPISRYWLIGTHAVGQCSDVAWKFSMSFFLSALTNHQSLVWVAAFGLSLGIAVTMGMPLVGFWIDSTTLTRLQIVRRVIAMEALAVGISSTALILLMHSFQKTGKLSIIFIAVLNCFGALAQLADQALLVIVERDWVVEMSLKDRTWLSTTNVWMRQIDLTAKVAGPMLAASIALPILLVHRTDSDGNPREDWTRAAYVIAIVSILALILQGVGASAIYRLVPALAIPRPHNTPRSVRASNGFCSGLKVYLSLPVSGAGLALSVLYLNALTFGNGIMTAYLLHRSMSIEWVGIWRGLAALAGLAGTWVFHMSPLSLQSTGLWSILYECVCLLVAALSVLPMNLDGSAVSTDISTDLLIGGVLASRTGLWVFDLCVTQLQQENVPDEVRALIGGIQQSLNSFFGIGSFAIGLLFPSFFDLYVLSAFGSVGLAVVLYSYAFRTLNATVINSESESEADTSMELPGVAV